VAFLYGAKLAVFAKKLETIVADDIKGYGPLRISEKEPQGIWTLDGREKMEGQRYMEIISKINYHVEIPFSTLEEVSGVLRAVLESDTFKYSRRPEACRFVP
jgi:hypothetical protein